jgi:hypothetical protein
VVTDGIAYLSQKADAPWLRDQVNIQFDRLDRRRIADLISDTATALIGTQTLDPFSRAAALRCIPVLLRSDDESDLLISESTLGLTAAMVDVLQNTGDLTAASELAAECMAWATDVSISRELFYRLAAQRLALAAICGTGSEVTILAAEVVEQNEMAAFGIAAGVWAGVLRSQDSATRGSAIQFAAALEPRLDPTVLGSAAYDFRLQLGGALVRAEEIEVARRMLAPMIAMPDGEPLRRDAEMLLSTARGAASRWLLPIAVLENELSATPESLTDDRWRLTSALADLYARIGDWRNAVLRGSEACRLCSEQMGFDHPQTLDARYHLASWNGESGDFAEGLRLSTELLPDQVRVLGPDQVHTLITRGLVASCTGNRGKPAEALRLFTQLLPDEIRVLGRDHPETLTTRSNVAAWTGECGKPAEARRLFTELLPDQIRVLGRDDRMTLSTRNNIAHWTWNSGDSKEALRLFTELLPDRVRVLGPDHPDTLRTRVNVAGLTGRCGDIKEALRLETELLPDQIRVLGPDHLYTLWTRNNIALYTSLCGDPTAALRLFTELLQDDIRVLGPNHPTTLATRTNIEDTRKQLG